MALYKQEGVNPAGGCLPLLLQMPILIAFYNLLAHSIELRHAPFMLWITDLSAKDPYYVTPILMTATMWIQQQMTPTGGDPTMRKVQNVMPLVMGFLFKDVPSGLVLYWLMQNVLTIGQQMLLNRFTDLGPAVDEAEGVLTPRGAEPESMARLVARPGPRRRRRRRPRDASGRLGARGRPADGPPGRTLADRAPDRAAPSRQAAPAQRRSCTASWERTAGRSTAPSCSSFRRRTRPPARRSWSSSATGRPRSWRGSSRRRARRGRGRRRGASSRGAPSRTASWISRRPRASPRSRGRRAWARRGGRSRSWRESCPARGRRRASGRSTSSRALEAALDFAEDVPPGDMARRRGRARGRRGGLRRARRGRRARRSAGPPQAGRDPRAAERGEVDALQRARRARPRHRHGRARHDARRDLGSRARSRARP